MTRLDVRMMQRPGPLCLSLCGEMAGNKGAGMMLESLGSLPTWGLRFILPAHGLQGCPREKSQRPSGGPLHAAYPLLLSVYGSSVLYTFVNTHSFLKISF